VRVLGLDNKTIIAGCAKEGYDRGRFREGRAIYEYRLLTKRQVVGEGVLCLNAYISDANDVPRCRRCLGIYYLVLAR